MTHKRSLLVIGLMIATILGPLLFAWGLLEKGDARQFRLNHHGDLLTSLPNIANMHFYDLHAKEHTTGKALMGKWWLFYVGAQQGDFACEKTLADLRQIHVALGKYAPKLHRAFIADPYNPSHACENTLDSPTAALSVFKLGKRDFHHLILPASNPSDRYDVGEFYLVDPRGNMMMRYSSQAPPQDILSDIKRLLRLSKAG